MRRGNCVKLATMDTPSIRVERMTPARRDDFLRFFDHEQGAAFADNPDWAGCYCHCYHVPKALDWSQFTAVQNRVAMTARIDAGEQEGYLAYAGDELVGWVNAHPYHKLPHACARLGISGTELDVPAFEAAAILCFVIAPAWRRRGVARALLAGALASLEARGLRVVDAFPYTAGSDAAPADHYHGPEALFLGAGFSLLREEGKLKVMRKRLGPPAP
jgi:ribosomal protein S18 acetylase RimI-like enzyme